MSKANGGPVLHMMVEVKARELEGRTLLALEAATRGFQVVLGCDRHIRAGILSGKLDPGIVYDKSLTRGKEHKLQALLDCGCRLVSQDEESGLLDFEYTDFLRFRSSPETVAMADAVFCWGHHDEEAWKQEYAVEAEKIRATGSPRVDFWRRDFAAYYRDPIEAIKQKYGRFILVSSNFVGANSYMTREERIAQGRRNGSIKNKRDEEALLQAIADAEEMYKLFVTLIKILAAELTDVNIVLRPHPAENMAAWQEDLADCENVHVVFEGGISPWLRASAALVHNGCTTGIEAYVGGVPTIAYVPFASRLNREVPNAISQVRDTPEGVCEILQTVLSGDVTPVDSRASEKDALIHRRLANLEGETAASRIADTLATLPCPTAGRLRGGMRRYTHGVRGKLIRTLTGKKLPDTKESRKFPGLKQQEIVRVQRDLARVDQKYARPRIRKLYGEIFVIEESEGGTCRQ